jgi:hypothetical protein
MEVLHSSNQEEILNFLSSLKFEGDGNIIVDHSEAGVYIRLANIPETADTPAAAAVSGDNLERAIIITGSSGVYNCNVIKNDGSVSENDTLLIATRATAYDLPADKRILGGYFPTETAG